MFFRLKWFFRIAPKPTSFHPKQQPPLLSFLGPCIHRSASLLPFPRHPRLSVPLVGNLAHSLSLLLLPVQILLCLCILTISLPSFLCTKAINNANELPFNYFLGLSCEEQFGARTQGGASQCVPSRRRAYGSTTAPLPPTDPPSSFPTQRLTSQNLITLLTCPICSVAGREGFNYICARQAGEPWCPISQGAWYSAQGESICSQNHPHTHRLDSR